MYGLDECFKAVSLFAQTHVTTFIQHRVLDCHRSVICKTGQELDFIMSKNMRRGMKYEQGSWRRMLCVEWHCKDGAIAFGAGALFSDGIGRIDFCITNLDWFFCMQCAHRHRVGFGWLDRELFYKLFG